MLLPSNFLGTKEWADLQNILERKSFFNKSDFLVKFNLPLKQSYLYSPRGPEIRNLKQFFEFAKDIAKKEHSFSLKIEPPILTNENQIKEIKYLGFKKTKDIQPSSTLIIDLKKNEEELLKEMNHNTRYAIRAAEKRGVKITKIEDSEEKKERFEDFWKIFKETQERQNLSYYSKDYYRKISEFNDEIKSELSFAEIDGKIVSAAIFLFYKNTATYLYAASLHDYARFNAPSALIWAAILEAKRKKCEIFDFWGVSDANPEWANITHFKKGFGGEIINYIGTWEYVFDWKWHLLYKMAKSIV